MLAGYTATIQGFNLGLTAVGVFTGCTCRFAGGGLVGVTSISVGEGRLLAGGRVATWVAESLVPGVGRRVPTTVLVGRGPLAGWVACGDREDDGEAGTAVPRLALWVGLF